MINDLPVYLPEREWEYPWFFLLLQNEPILLSTHEIDTYFHMSSNELQFSSEIRKFMEGKKWCQLYVSITTDILRNKNHIIRLRYHTGVLTCLILRQNSKKQTKYLQKQKMCSVMSSQ